MPSSFFPADPTAPLRGGFDLAKAVEGTPAHVRTKGLFFLRLRSALGDAWEEVARTLDQPPRGGRYLPFTEYVSRDHVRLIDAVARIRSPHLSAREAHRQLGVASFEDVVQSIVGRVALSLVPSEPLALLGRFPDACTLFVKGTLPVRAMPLEGGGIRIVFDDFLGVPEYVFGLLEAIVRSARATPTIDVSVEPPATRFDVRWIR